MRAKNRPFSFRTPRSQAAPIVLVLSLSCLLPTPGQACMFSQPPPPVCGKSVVISTAVPRVHLLPGGGTFDVTALVFFTLTDFPPGAGACPAGPYDVDVEVTVTCTPSGDGGGTLIGAPLSFGFNELTVPVTVPAGPSRICDIDAKATVTLADGMVLEAMSDSLVCLAEPAPGNPERPRLDLQLLGGAGAEISRDHPGDQALFTYRVTNNDPTETFSGQLTAESLNTARLPGSSGPMPPGTGVFSISDPVQGDNFPLAFTDQLFEGCVLLPADPANPAVPEILEPLVLGPGQSRDIEIHSRSWGMCANGSCSRGTVAVDGSFTDESTGLACAGFVAAADTGAPPTFGWPDAGEVAEANSPSPGRLKLRARPRPQDERDIDVELAQIVLLVDGQQVPAAQLPFSDTVMPELGRSQLQFLPQEAFGVKSFFDVFVEIDVLPPQDLEAIVGEFNLLPGIPTGFDDVAPSGRALIELSPGGFEVDSFFDITVQVEGIGIDDLGERRRVQWTNVNMSRRPDGTGLRVGLGGGRVEPGPGTELDALELIFDFRGFTSSVEQGQLGEIFTDGFESGNVSRWSSSSL